MPYPSKLKCPVCKQNLVETALEWFEEEEYTEVTVFCNHCETEDLYYTDLDYDWL